VDDLADLAINSVPQEDNLILDAAGPKVVVFEDLVRQTALGVGAKPGIIPVSPQTVSGSIGLRNLSLNMSRLNSRLLPAASAHGQAVFHEKNKAFHTFSTGRMEYDTASKK